MRGLFFSTILIITSLQVSGQDRSIIDSLKLISNKESNLDTQRLKALYSVTESFGTNMSDSILKYGNELIDLSKELKNKYFEGQAYKRISMMYINTGNHKTAIDYCDKAIDLFTQENHYSGIAAVLLNKGICYRRIGELSNAENAYLAGQKIAKKHEIIHLEINALSNLGNIMDDMGNYKDAIDFHTRALELREKRDDILGIGISCLNIGIMHFDQGDFNDARDYFEKARKCFKEKNHPSGISVSLMNLGNVERKQKNNDDALNYYRKSINIQDSAGSDYLIVANNLNIAEIELERKNFQKASFHNGKALKLALKQNYKEGVILSYTSLGNIYNEKGRNDSALFYYKKAYDIAKEVNAIREISSSASSVYLILKKMNKYEEALPWFEEHVILEDSMKSEEVKRDIIKKDLELQFAKKAAADSIKTAEATKVQTAQLEAEKAKSTKRTQQNYFLIVGLVLAFGFGIVLYNRNRITKKQNLIIAQQKEQLAELDHLKNDFFTNITHEFRTPLTVILGAASNMENSTDAELIKRNGQRLLNLINQILELSKLEDGSLGINKKQIDAVAFTKYLTDSYRSLAMSQNKSLDFKTFASEQFMDLDEDKYQTIIGNLVSNAVKFTPENGLIEIETKSDGKQLEINIKDSGEGIPEGELDRLFDRFYQVKGSKSQKIGSGVGLALTKELVLRFNGGITVKNQAEGGAIFTVTLPITNKAPLSDFRASTITTAKHTLVENDEEQLQDHNDLPILLLVEDEPDIQQFIKSTLADNYKLLVANNGEEGVNIALEQVPDIILSDVMMPVKDGLELTNELKNDARTSHIPIALLTAKVDLESRLQGLKRGADVYLPKPFEKEELLLQLNNLQEQQKRVRNHFSLTEIKNDSTPANEAIEIENEFISSLKNTITANFENEKFGIEELSKTMGMSRTQLHRKLKALTGKSASQFVNDFKIDKACELLLLPENNVSEVAYSLGFTDPNYFTRVFTKIKGLSPTEFLVQKN
ncbi:MAG: tetratricopeptide repeat protein [Bacteroidia bacterium]